MSRPQSLSEWAEYIAELSGNALFSQAVAFNTQEFARHLVAEGATMGDVKQVALLFVRQLRATGTKVPSGGAWDLLKMAQTDPICRQGPKMSEEEAHLLTMQYQPGSDDLDDFELEATLDA
jgi:hypothetical protein